MTFSVKDLLHEAKHLAKTADDDKEPYKSKYAAADKLEIAMTRNAAGLSKEAIAVLQTVRGLILLETDSIADGQEDVDVGLKSLCDLPGPRTLERIVLIHAAYGGLGQLWSSREQHLVAIDHLQAAQKVYEDTHELWRAGGQIPVGDITGQEEEELRAELESQHTFTLLCLAHTYTQCAQREKAAVCCAATLGRQLQSGEFNRSEWVQHTLQLSGFFVDRNCFALVEYCVRAAKIVASQGAAEEQVVEEDVAANMLIAEGKLYGSRLQASYQLYVENIEPEFSYPSPESVPNLLRFPTLDLPPFEELLWGKAALVDTFEGARDLFNKALPPLKKALEFYNMDSWVSEHVPLLMDISNLYRLLAGFETDSHRKCVMHKQRARLLEGKSATLNPNNFQHFVRSLDMEVGNIYRTIFEIKENGSRPDSKVVTAAATAMKHYDRVVRSFLVGDEWPKRVRPADDEALFLHACFNLGRSQRAAMGADIMSAKNSDALQWAISTVEKAYDYIQRYDLLSEFPEAPLTKELVELLQSRIALQCRLSS